MADQTYALAQDGVYGQANGAYTNALDAIPDSVTNHWPMDEGGGSTLTDVEGGRDLTLVGGSWDGDTLVLDGSNDYAYESNSDNHFTELDDFSAFGWAYLDTSDLSRQYALLGSYATDGDNRSWRFEQRDSSSERFWFATSPDGSNFTSEEVGDGPYPLEEWYSWAFTRDADTGDVEFYINGDYVTTVPFDNGTLYANSEEFWVGAIQFADMNWDGYLKDFAFAEGHTFSDSEIQQLHDTTGPDQGSDAETQLAADGGWNYRDRPMAYHHNGTLYSAYIDTSGNQKVISYDPDTGDITETTVDTGPSDLHNNPNLNILSDGRIIVFTHPTAGYEDDLLRYSISDDPDDISSFGPVQTESWDADSSYIGGAGSTVVHDGTVYHQTNLREESGTGDRVEGLWVTDDDGGSWDKYRLWSFPPDGSGSDNRSYTTCYLHGDYIHFIATSRDLSNSTQIGYGVYYAKYDIVNEEFLGADDSFLFDWSDTPVTDTDQMDAVWERDTDGGGSESGMWMDIKTDSSGTPHITFWTSPNDDEPPFTRYWARPESGSWEYYEIDSTTYDIDYWTAVGPSASLDPRDPTRVYIDQVADGTNETTRIDGVETDDGGDNWSVVEQVSDEASKAHFPNAIYGIDSESNESVVWLEGSITEWDSYNTSVLMK